MVSPTLSIMLFVIFVPAATAATPIADDPSTFMLLFEIVEFIPPNNSIAYMCVEEPVIVFPSIVLFNVLEVCLLYFPPPYAYSVTMIPYAASISPDSSIGVSSVVNIIVLFRSVLFEAAPSMDIPLAYLIDVMLR